MNNSSGTKMKKMSVKMYVLSILAIVFILIMHMISWSPIISKSNEIREDWKYHQSRSYYHSECTKCEDYKETIDEYNKMGADLWQKTITNCILIALVGTITYGIGVIAEKKQPTEYTPYLNN